MGHLVTLNIQLLPHSILAMQTHTRGLRCKNVTFFFGAQVVCFNKDFEIKSMLLKMACHVHESHDTPYLTTQPKWLSYVIK